MNQPNIVLILVDQMRADCVGMLGRQPIETPNLDHMGKNGYVFDSAYSAVPTCIASRAAIMTGLSQRTHGRIGYQDGVPWNYQHTLAGELTRAGYHTQCVGKMHVFPERSLLGYHNVVLHDGYLRNFNNHLRLHSEAYAANDDYLLWLQRQLGVDKTLIDSGLESNSWVARTFPYEEHYHPTNWVAQESIDFLRRRDPGRPFFLTASFVRPHSPLDPPQCYYDMYINNEFIRPPMGNWADANAPSPLDINAVRGALHDKALHRARAAYYALITHVDHQIGRLLQAIDEYRLMPNTVFLFASDHGDLLGDHNLFRKSLPYEGSAKVPMILYDPGKLLGDDVGRILANGPAELRDIMPTLLDIAGAPIPTAVEGKSLLPMLRDPAYAPREYLHGEHAFGESTNQYITDGKRKYIWFTRDGREQFFDLERDPLELENLINSAACHSEIERFRHWLIEELRGREEGYTDGERLIAGRQPKYVLDSVLPK